MWEEGYLDLVTRMGSEDLQSNGVYVVIWSFLYSVITSDEWRVTWLVG